jgi:NAD(P)-dependent dehydrogenase (short-subunit alcohol dehydrogenase family)
MGFLQGKKILITGLLSTRSIAYGIAAVAQREGATLAFTYQNEAIKDRVIKLSQDFKTDLLFPCDVASDAEIDALFAGLGKHWDGLDGVVHAIAFAPREQLDNDYLSSVTREGYPRAHYKPETKLRCDGGGVRVADALHQPLGGQRIHLAGDGGGIEQQGLGDGGHRLRPLAPEQA